MAGERPPPSKDPPEVGDAGGHLPSRLREGLGVGLRDVTGPTPSPLRGSSPPVNGRGVISSSRCEWRRGRRASARPRRERSLRRAIMARNTSGPREAADALDQIAIAVLVVRHGFSDARDHLVGPTLVELRKPRPVAGRELHAIEAPATLQYAVRFAERCGDVGDVPDAEHDRVGVEARRRRSSGLPHSPRSSGAR